MVMTSPAPPATFLLKGSCGHDVPVAPTQAGEELHCSCGQLIQVPKLRELRRLPVATESTPPLRDVRDKSWSSTQGWVFGFGFPLAVISLAFLAYFIRERVRFDLPKPVFDEKNFPVDIRTLGPRDAWKTWELFRDMRLIDRPMNEYLRIRAYQGHLEKRIWQAGVCSAFGVLVTLSAWFLPKPPR